MAILAFRNLPYCFKQDSGPRRGRTKPTRRSPPDRGNKQDPGRGDETGMLLREASALWTNTKCPCCYVTIDKVPFFLFFLYFSLSPFFVGHVTWDLVCLKLEALFLFFFFSERRGSLGWLGNFLFFCWIMKGKCTATWPVTSTYYDCVCTCRESVRCSWRMTIFFCGLSRLIPSSPSFVTFFWLLYPVSCSLWIHVCPSNRLIL